MHEKSSRIMVETCLESISENEDKIKEQEALIALKLQKEEESAKEK